MASRTVAPPPSPEPALRAFGVACSGGRDSLALLHAACRSASAGGLQVVALHVHHGLQTQADDWEETLRRTVARWARAGWPVRLAVERLSGAPGPAESVEAWARRERYAALQRLAQAQGCGLVLLAHHRRDQAETVLLQALRQAGPAGLSAMPRERSHAGIRWVRPWLEQRGEAIESYARRFRLHGVQDPSNADSRFDRSRLRQAVWPALVQAFPQAESALAQVARWQQEAAQALAALAQADLQACTEATQGSDLCLKPWRALPPERRVGVLRAWLVQRVAQEAAGDGPHGVSLEGAAVAAFDAWVPGGKLLSRLMTELGGARTGARWMLPGAGAGFGGGIELRCAPGARLVWGLGRERAAGGAPPGSPGPAGMATRCTDTPAHPLATPGRHRLGAWPGEFRVTPLSPQAAARGEGVPVGWLQGAVLRERQGGERFRAAPGRPSRSLKHQFQAAQVEAWGRDGPLLWSGPRMASGDGPDDGPDVGPKQGRRLLWVAALGPDACCRQPAGGERVQLQWHLDAAAASTSARRDPDAPRARRQPPAGGPR